MGQELWGRGWQEQYGMGRGMGQELGGQEQYGKGWKGDGTGTGGGGGGAGTVWDEKGDGTGTGGGGGRNSMG